MSSPHWRGETEWGIVLFFHKDPAIRNQPTQLRKQGPEPFGRDLNEADSVVAASLRCQEAYCNG